MESLKRSHERDSELYECGTHQALEYLWQQFRVQKVEWVVDVDVRKFFDTLDHVLLRNVLRRKVQDGVLLWLVDQWLKAGVMEGGHLSRSVEGTPQGGVISPLLSNIFLHEALDQTCKRNTEWFAQNCVGITAITGSPEMVAASRSILNGSRSVGGVGSTVVPARLTV